MSNGNKFVCLCFYVKILLSPMKEHIPEKEFFELGTIENPIVDSQMSREEALRSNPNFFLSPEIFIRQVLLEVIYKSLDEKYHRGQIVVDKDLKIDVENFFNFLLENNFPVQKVVPIAHARFDFDDGLSMAEGNSSGFNPRNIAGTDRPSNHALGRAIDVNPFQNPFIKDGAIEPKGAIYDPTKPGTFVSGSSIVEFLKMLGWIWGGDYKEIKDYHHFEKPFKKP